MAGGLTTQLSDVMKPMLRRAGITTLPGTTPSSDQFGELIPEINRMMDSLSLNGHNIFTQSIDRYAMSPQQTSYFIGPTGDWVAPRPLSIFRANVVLTDSAPELHLPVKLLTDDEWADHIITELPAPWPWQLYNDGAYPDSKLYLYGYPTENNDLELFTWQQVQTGFVAATDAVTLPPGYEDVMVTEGALRCISLYPLDCRLTGIQVQKLEQDAMRAREKVQILNTTSRPYYNDGASIGGNGGDLSMREFFYRFGAGIGS